MNEIASVAAIGLAAIVHASLQLGLGGLLLLYHESLGKHVRPKTRKLVSSFIFGVVLIVFLLLATSCFIVSHFDNGIIPSEIVLIIIGLLFALAIIMWFFYYRRGNTTELWLPRPVARFIANRAKLTANRSEAFSLGVLTSFAELPLTVVLLTVAATNIFCLEPGYRLLAVAGYSLITIFPLIILRLAIRSGRNVADVQKWRTRNKTFLRIFSGCGFVILGLFLLAFSVLGVA